MNANAIGIVIALPAESRPLTGRAVPFGQITSGPWGSLIVGGMGRVNAERAAEQLVDAGVRQLLSWGCAGGLRPDLRPGQLLLPKTIKSSRADEALVTIELPEGLFETLKDLNPVTEPMISAEAVSASPAAKRHLHATSGAAAVDLESYAVAQVARQRGLSCCVIRAIADPANEGLPEAVSVSTNANGETSLPKLFLELLRNPGEIGSILSLARNFGAAMTTLGNVASRIVEHGGES